MLQSGQALMLSSLVELNELINSACVLTVKSSSVPFCSLWLVLSMLSISDEALSVEFSSTAELNMV